MNICLAISCLLALAASVHGDGLGYGGGLVYAPGHASVDYYAYPRYAFEYAVRDPHTGDNKAQWEKRDGDVVKGAYSLVEPDGSIRVVEYYADDKTGFNAVVKRLGPNLHPAVPASIYKAPIPVLGGLGHAPISVGPVAKLGGLAAAPLISGPILGGNLVKPIAPIIKSPILPYEPLIKAPIYEPVIKAPIYEPVIKTPIYEPIIKTPIIPYEPIFKSPIVPFEPIVKSPILPIAKPIAPLLPYGGYEHLPGPIYKSGPILSDLAHISPILKSGPIYPGKLDLGLPILKEPYGLGYGGYNKDREILGHGLLANSWGLGNPYLGKH